MWDVASWQVIEGFTPFSKDFSNIYNVMEDIPHPPKKEQLYHKLHWNYPIYCPHAPQLQFDWDLNLNIFFILDCPIANC